MLAHWEPLLSFLVVVWPAGDWHEVVSPRRVCCHLHRRCSDVQRRRLQMRQDLAASPVRRATAFSNVPRTLVKERLPVLLSVACFPASHLIFCRNQSSSCACCTGAFVNDQLNLL